MLEEIPEFITISLASALAGLSRKTFKRRYISTRLVNLSWDHLWQPVGTGRGFLYRWELEKALGRKFTLAEYCAADRRLAPARRRSRLYQRTKRNH